MFRQTFQKLMPTGNVVAQQLKRNFGVTAVVCEKAANLDPIQQLFLDKIREYKKKSVGGKLVDATPESEATLAGMLNNLEGQYQAKGVDMTKFPVFNFEEPTLAWPGLSDEQKAVLQASMDAEQAAEQAAAQAEAAGKEFDGWEMYRR